MDKRRLKRNQLIYYLKVFDRDWGLLMGRLVDITVEGVMLFSERPIETNKEYMMKLELPATPDSPAREVKFDAEALWTKPDVNPDFWDTGFRFTKVSKSDIAEIEALVSEYLLPE